MTTYFWIVFTSAAFGAGAYFALRYGIPTSRLVASAAAAAVSIGVVAGLYVFQRYEAHVSARQATPIQRTPLRPAQPDRGHAVES
jgi:hypothetical protein